MQLLISICGIDQNFITTEDLLGLKSMKGTTTAQYLFKCIVHCVEKNALSWNKMTCITTQTRELVNPLEKCRHDKTHREQVGS